MQSKLGVWLINLDRSTARYAAMKTRLAALGLEYTRLSATDGYAEWDHLVRNVDVPAFRRNVGREILPGEIGCYVSHLNVWQALQDSNCDVALVMEDDVVFHDDFLAAVDQVLAKRDLWDLVKLNKIRANQPIMQHKLGAYSLNSYIGAFTGTGAYLITRVFAQAQMSAMLPIVRPIDHVLDRYDGHSFRHFGLEPFPSHVDDGNTSTITGAGFTSVKKFPWYARSSVYAQKVTKPIKKAFAIALSRARMS